MSERTRDTERCGHGFQLADGTITECINRREHSGKHVADRADEYLYIEWGDGSPFGTVRGSLLSSEITHLCPPEGSGVMPCCERTPFEVPRKHRMTTNEDLVTCAVIPDQRRDI